MIAVAALQDPPLHLFLGQDDYDLVLQKINPIQKDMQQVQDLATATAFEEVTAS